MPSAVVHQCVASEQPDLTRPDLTSPQGLPCRPPSCTSVSPQSSLAESEAEIALLQMIEAASATAQVGGRCGTEQTCRCWARGGGGTAVVPLEGREVC